MASAAAKAVRKAEVRHRLDREVTAIAHRLHIDIPDAITGVRDVDLAVIVDLERQADILGSVNAALEERGIEVPEIDEIKGVKLDNTASRDVLNRLAADLGIDDAADKRKFPNKDAVIAAIEAAIASTDDGEPESDEEPAPDTGEADADSESSDGDETDEGDIGEEEGDE
jgi:hypothetical protein